MKKKTLVMLVLVGVLIFGAVQAAWAAWGQGAGSQATPVFRNLAQELELTGEQAQKIQEIHRNCYENTSALRQKMWDLRAELRSLRWDPSATREQFEQKIAEIQDLRSQFIQQRQQARDQIRSILTDEQIAKWQQLCPYGSQGRQGGMGPGRGQGFGRGMGPCPYYNAPVNPGTSS
ncbi:MAG: Spy/CpxP family protein refolding chaperone [Peptococcaceae bacterium]|nr:Spy/CpxP family protein refolding chaperone [Peptococcaceae bacterium]